MDEPTRVRDLLERAIVPEPPIGAVAQNALRAGIKLRRRRQARGIAAGAVVAAIFAALAITGTTGNRAATPAPAPATVYVLGGSQTVSTVTPISSTTHQPESPIVVSTGHPWDAQMAVTPDGKTIWAADGDTVAPVSTATNTAGTPIRVVPQRGGNGIQQLLIGPDGKTLYVLDSTQGKHGLGHPGGPTVAVTPISTSTARAGKPIELGQGTEGPAEMAITPNGRTLYVVFLWPPGTVPSYVIPISTATDRAGKPIRIAADISAIVAAPDGRTVYLVGQPLAKGSSEPSATIEVTPIATATNRLGKAVVIGNGGRDDQTPAAVSPDGQTVYLVAPHEVIPFSMTTNTAGKPISLGSADVVDIAMAPDGRTAYVMSVSAGGFHPAGPGCANSPGAVTPIATATDKAGTPIRVIVGCYPLVIAVTPDGKTLYVVSHSGVTPVATATGRAGKRMNIEMPQAILIVPGRG